LFVLFHFNHEQKEKTMESIQGKKPFHLSANEFSRRIAGYDNLWLDLGTGDGRFVRQMARENPGSFFLGLDACRENLRESSRSCPDNALFLIASAQDLPAELNGLPTQVSINFPWGSLLDGLLDGDPGILGSLARVARPGASLTLRLNGGALSEAGWEAEAGIHQVTDTLWQAGFLVQEPVRMSASALRAFPSTWARRLAVGRDPRSWVISARNPLQTIAMPEIRLTEPAFV